MNLYPSKLKASSTVIITLMLGLAFFSGITTATAQSDSDWKAVEEAVGRPGQMQPGDVFRFGMPRKDLHVTVGDVVVKPTLALGSWAAFKRGESGAMRSRDVVWGVNFKRFIRSKNEEDLWSGWRRTYGANKISEAGELRGITDIGSGRLFIVKPYGLVGFNHLPESVAGTGLTPGMSALHTGGLDIKLGLRSNLVANLTGNTDFADSDVDVQQFNLTPYKLFFPEKRQFFLENAGVFAFPMSLGDSADQLFFSRQIGIDPVTGQQVPINGGGKVTGTLGGFELGAMDVDTRTSGPNPWANFAVLRVKRSLWGTGSYIGVMGIDKRSGREGSSFNQTSGVDGRFVLFRNLVLNGYAAQTRTPGFSGGQSNLGAGATFRSNWLDVEAEHRKIGPNLNPEVGFLERSDCVCDFVDTTIKQRPEVTGIRELQFEGFLFHAPDTHAKDRQRPPQPFASQWSHRRYSRCGSDQKRILFDAR